MLLEPTESWALALGYRVVHLEVEQEGGVGDFFFEFGVPGLLLGTVVTF